MFYDETFHRISGSGAEDSDGGAVFERTDTGQGRAGVQDGGYPENQGSGFQYHGERVPTWLYRRYRYDDLTRGALHLRRHSQI